MAERYLLMCADKCIAEFTGAWKIHIPELMPKGLNLKHKTILGTPSALEGFQAWLAGRVLSIDRMFAKQLLIKLKLTQDQDIYAKAKIALEFRGINLIDSYWLKTAGEYESVKWADVNLRVNPLSNIISCISLTGSAQSLQPDNMKNNAEITTVGLCAKGWFRENDGLYLYKAGGYIGDEVDREVCASEIIDCFNVYGNLKYEKAVKHGVECSRSKLMSDDKISIVHTADMMIWCKNNSVDFMEYVKKRWLKEYAQMVVIDYLIANSDRHFRNWGFYEETESGKILGLHPLYDHNQAFHSDYLENENLEATAAPEYTQKELAEQYIGFSGLRMIRQPERQEFPSEYAYGVFVERCGQLGLLPFYQ